MRCCKLAVVLSVFLLLSFNELKAQETTVFEMAEAQCPFLPHGLLEAVSFTNTHCHHLTDANYTVSEDDLSAMPRTYGMMGLVRNGKGYFRENLKAVAELSGFTEKEIVEDPYINVLAYAKACEKMALQLNVHAKSVEAYRPVIEALSELPLNKKKDELPMKMMLYSVYDYLGVDLPALFGEDYELLSAQGLSFSKDTDYPAAIWIPAPDCNFGERTDPVSAVVIHYTEGSYAGAISWFQNCEASVSAHYVIRSSDGQVAQMVRESDKAWHARSANAYSIGVEHEAYGDIVSYFTEAMYVSSADLMRNICSRYEVIDGHRTFYRDTLDNGTALNVGVHDLGGPEACIKIRGHQHYPGQSHTDPGPYWDWNYYYKLINEGTPVQILGGAGITEGNLNHENYGDDERMIWVIESDPNTVISLDFSSFALERDYDFLWIYDGDDVYAPKIGRWNTRKPGKVTSSGNALCVEFRSDCATTAEGWKAHWTADKIPHVDTLHIVTEKHLEIYPNPVQDKLYIQLPETGYYDAEIVNQVGVKVFKGRFWKSTFIDVSYLPQGIYNMRFRRLKDGSMTVKRFIR
ncbi:MAG: N-acetylmuramoyl-L-alanine amidase [Bacteroidales bacterium]|nr:N-acetylmuramoyl-L-alanine amidase [Bacteroidales bacterium]